MKDRNELPLTGCAAMVTRPGERGAELVEQLNALGAKAMIAEVMKIELLPASSGVQTAMSTILPSTLLVFVSVHAVKAFAEAVAISKCVLPFSNQVAAVGSATAGALQELGMKVDFAPADKMNSEGLLEALSGAELRGRQVALFRGQQGRELLSDTLRNLGAHVIEVESYHRLRNAIDLSSEIFQLIESPRQAIFFTSVDLIEAFLEVTEASQKPSVLTCDLVVLSERIANTARKMGFSSQITVAPTTDNDGLVQGMRSLYANPTSS